MPDPASKRIRVNGREDWTNAGNVQELVRQYGLQGARIVVELDGVILSREAWADTQLAEGAQLELVHFVGGG
nr:sulfur carrier protein ThiS [Paenibacillus methanolicus]